MKTLVFAVYKLLVSILLLFGTWFAIGPWLLNQQSSLMYLLGIIINISVIIPVVKILQSVGKDIKKIGEEQ